MRQMTLVKCCVDVLMQCFLFVVLAIHFSKSRLTTYSVQRAELRLIWLGAQVHHPKETGLFPLACPQLCARSTPVTVLSTHFPAFMWHLYPHCPGRPPPRTPQTHPASAVPGTEFQQHLSGITNCQIVSFSPVNFSNIYIYNLRLMVRNLKAGTVPDSPQSLDNCPTQSYGLGHHSFQVSLSVNTLCWCLPLCQALKSISKKDSQDPSAPQGLHPSKNYSQISMSTHK